MSAQHPEGWTRRRFLGGLTVAGAAGLLGPQPRPVAAEPPPETTRIRLVKSPAICLSPEYLAEELLRLEGFSEIDYVEIDQRTTPDVLLAKKADITVHVPPALQRLLGHDRLTTTEIYPNLSPEDVIREFQQKW